MLKVDKYLLYLYLQLWFPFGRISSGSILRSGGWRADVVYSVFESFGGCLSGWMEGRGSEQQPWKPCLLLVRLRQRLGCDWDTTVTWASIASIESNAKTQSGYVTLSVPSTLVLLSIYWQNKAREKGLCFLKPRWEGRRAGAKTVKINMGRRLG